MAHTTTSLIVVLAAFVVLVSGHGRMEKPAARNSAWRFGFKTPANYNDNGLVCQMSGKCGLCGDSFGAKKPRPHEDGGKFGTGTIVGKYSAGETISAGVLLTANHKGYMKFELCNLDSGEETQECFKPLKADGGDKVNVPSGKNKFDVKVQLPEGVTCKRCVFRWKYYTGNYSGELYLNCADISIS